MAQQMLNGSYYDGSVTVTNRMSYRYAVVNPPETGKHRKTEKQRERRHALNLRMRTINSLKKGLTSRLYPQPKRLRV